MNPIRTYPFGVTSHGGGPERRGLIGITFRSIKGVPPRPGTPICASGRIFPLRLGGQPLAGPPTVDIRIIPAHIRRGVIFLAGRGLIVDPGIKRGVMMIYGSRSSRRLNEFLVLGIGHLKPIHVKGLDLHLMLWDFIHPDLESYLPFLACASHQKLTPWDINHSF
jgi:hypothetical protein